MKCYVIQDAETEEIWVSYRGRCSWSRAYNAKRAWVVDNHNWRDPITKFDAQTTYVCRAATITPTGDPL